MEILNIAALLAAIFILVCLLHMLGTQKIGPFALIGSTLAALFLVMYLSFPFFMGAK